MLRKFVLYFFRTFSLGTVLEFFFFFFFLTKHRTSCAPMNRADFAGSGEKLRLGEEGSHRNLKCCSKRSTRTRICS